MTAPRKTFAHYVLFTLSVLLWVILLEAFVLADAGLAFGVVACQYCLRMERAKL